MDALIGDHTLGISNTFCIDIRGKLLYEFLSKPNRRALSVEYPVTMSYALGMNCRIYPNGSCTHQSGKVTFLFMAKTNITKYDQIQYYVHIRCREIEFEW